MRRFALLALTALAVLFVGCTSFNLMQTCRFVDEDGRFAEVEYGQGVEAHKTTFVSPVTHKTMENSSRLRVRVHLPKGEKFMAFECMNYGPGTMYKTDDDEWLYNAQGVKCFVWHITPDGRDYYLVFSGVICQAPTRAK